MFGPISFFQIYAVGATCIELLTGDMPFLQLTNKQVELQVFAQQIFLSDTLPQDLDTAWQPLLAEIATYVSHDPTQRPTATQAIERLLMAYREDGQPIEVAMICFS